MSSFNSFLTRMYKQTVVYWGAPTLDGFSNKTFADPIELSARYERVDELVKGPDGEELLSKARVWVPQEVDEGGYIYLGTLDDLDSNPDDPKTIEGADEILSFRKMPQVGSTTEFILRANLK